MYIHVVMEIQAKMYHILATYLLRIRGPTHKVSELDGCSNKNSTHCSDGKEREDKRF